jgi:hypothetical protein
VQAFSIRYCSLKMRGWLRIGLDTAKSAFQIHGVNETGKVEIKRKLRRSELIAFFEKQESALW